ncbi:MAG: M20/M25/M40 family metallo-hydrolase [Eudoraea sp.]|nr:M20/M25/M40 family metallo-hydrolase [Eudoraea sp.]
MKKIIFLGLLGILAGCKSTISAENFSDAEKVGTIMNYLSSDELKGRDSGSEGIEMAANYIVNSFKDHRIAPFYESYLDTLSNYEKAAFNVVGFLEGNDEDLKKEYILIGAHYDHIGIVNAISGDSIANGANDNATGSTTVLEIARYFAKAKSNKRSLIFAFFSAEEKGLKGSQHLAAKMKEDKVNLYAMLNFEMTGVPMVEKDYLVYITGYNKSNLAEVGNKYAKENLIGFLPTAEKYNLFQRSDNYPFHELFEVPSQTFSTFDFTYFDHYHKVGDEPELMNFRHMAQLVNKMIPVVQGIANSPAKEISYK